MKDVINDSKLKDIAGGTSEGFAHKYNKGDIFKTTSAPVLYYKIIELLDGVDKTDNCPIYMCEVYKKVSICGDYRKSEQTVSEFTLSKADKKDSLPF